MSIFIKVLFLVFFRGSIFKFFWNCWQHLILSKCNFVVFCEVFLEEFRKGSYYKVNELSRNSLRQSKFTRFIRAAFKKDDPIFQGDSQGILYIGSKTSFKSIISRTYFVTLIHHKQANCNFVLKLIENKEMHLFMLHILHPLNFNFNFNTKKSWKNVPNK